MARYHFWSFILNEAGEPIEDAKITVKLAGTDEIACIYFDEFGSANSCTTPSLSGGPQLSSLSNGYYEFWIGDSSEVYGYRNDQKFKIEWIREGVAHGEIDYVDIFPLGDQIEPMSTTDCISPSIVKNKLISDYYACKWDMHSDSDVIDAFGNFASVHGLEFVNVEELDTLPNKIINNYYGWHWDHHRLSTVQSYHPSAGRPHGIEEVNVLDGSNTIRNKVVSNQDMYNIHSRITNLNVYVNDQDAVLQAQIDTLGGLTEQSRSGWWIIYQTDWIQGPDYNEWYCPISHNLDTPYPIVVCWDMTTNKIVQTANVEYISSDVIRVIIDNEDAPNNPSKQFAVRIANGGIHRHPME